MTVTEEELQRIVAAAVKMALKEVKGIEERNEEPTTQVETTEMGAEELDEAMRLMQSNRGKGNEPMVGIFWYSPQRKTLFGVRSHRVSDYTKANARSEYGSISCSEMHEDVWKKEYHRQKYKNDGIGPSIYCYLNTSAFVNGGDVNSTPYFYAQLTDKDGINAAGSGLGHDMELVVDGDPTMTYSLNDYFQYDFGDYRSGAVGYSLPALAEGEHKLSFRAWDVLNNSSVAELKFRVVLGLQPNCFSVECTRNPATTTTSFIINHDRTGSQMDVTLEIFDASGRMLWAKTETGVSTDNTYTLDWDLTTSNGGRLQTGVYLYRVLISCDGSKKASQSQKLIVLSNR